MEETKIIEIVNEEPWLGLAVAVGEDGGFIRVKHLIDIIKRKDAEIERLRENALPECEQCILTIIKNAKTEAIKEFWERLKLEREPITRVVFVEKGDRLINEMECEQE